MFAPRTWLLLFALLFVVPFVGHTVPVQPALAQSNPYDWRVSDSRGLGELVASAGDVNGDGYSDVLVNGSFSVEAELPGSGQQGTLLYLGSSDGLQTTPSWEKYNASSLAATTGDINNDGYSDVLIAAADNHNSAVSLYLGGADGLSITATWEFIPDELYTVYIQEIAPAGDVNADQYSDFLVRAYHSPPDPEEEFTRAYLFLGGPTGPQALADWSLSATSSGLTVTDALSGVGDLNADGFHDVAISVNKAEDGGAIALFAGSAVGLQAEPTWLITGATPDMLTRLTFAPAGDINGDTFADMLVARPYEEQTDTGIVWLYHGGAQGPTPLPQWSLVGTTDHATVGRGIGPGGDINGDGFSDIVVGAYHGRSLTTAGNVRVFLGKPGGLNPTPHQTITGTVGGGFGNTVTTAGDVNGDGYADFVVGSYENAAYGYYGGPLGPGTSPSWTYEGNQELAELWEARAAGDVNGDGLGDLLQSGLYGNDSGESYEQVKLFLGNSTQVLTTPVWSAVSATPSSGLARAFGRAGDVDGDGYDDVFVGEGLGNKIWLYRGGSSGLNTIASWSYTGTGSSINIAGAGDLNGDGYSDLAVGFPYYETCGYKCSYGKVLIFFGSANGLAATPNWQHSDEAIFTGYGGYLAIPGDVNGDGFDDLAIGGTGGEGDGFIALHLGGPSGPLKTPIWQLDGMTFPGNISGAGRVGDPNNDGYADLAIFNNCYTTEPSCQPGLFLFAGTNAGVSPDPLWDAAGQPATIEAGDIDGDGYSDVLLLHNNAVQIYPGGPDGPGLSPVWTTATGYGERGNFVGDLHGDGYSDIAVVEPGYSGPEQYEGRATVFSGNRRPGISLAPQARRSTSEGPITHGGLSDAHDRVGLQLFGRSPLGRGLVRLEWEIQAAGAPFTGTPQGTTAWFDSGTAGVELSALATQLNADTRYSWRIRLGYHLASSPFQRHGRWLSQPWGSAQQARIRTASEPAAPPPITTSTSVAPQSIQYTQAAQGITLSATVAGGNEPLNVGNVIFAVSGARGIIGTPATTSLYEGGATTSYTLPMGLATGTYTITASYSGGAGVLPSSAQTQLRILPATSEIVLMVEIPSFEMLPNLAAPILRVTTVVSSSGGAPTGQVELFVNSSSAGRFDLVAGQTPVLELNACATDYTIVAHYLGDSSFAAASSQPVEVLIGDNCLNSEQYRVFVPMMLR